MEGSTPVALSMSAWSSPRRVLLLRAVIAFLCLLLGGLMLLVALLLLDQDGSGPTWDVLLTAATLAVPAAVLAVFVRLVHAQLREVRAGTQRGEVQVFPDYCRIHFPGVLSQDLVLAADQIRAVSVDDRRPAWLALYWYRFPIASGRPGPRHVGCLFRPHLQNRLQLLAPAAGIPNVALLLTRPMRLEQATGLGRIGEAVAYVVAEHDDIESTADLPGARPVDPERTHHGIFLRVDSPALAREAFAGWSAARQVLTEADVRLVPATPMPGAARKAAGALGFAWALIALGVTASAILTRSWNLVVPVVLVPMAVGGLAYETFRSLRALGRRPRAGAAALGSAGLLLVTVILGIFEIRDVSTFDDPPPPPPPTSYYVPETPSPSPPTGVPFPTQGTSDPLR